MTDITATDELACQELVELFVVFRDWHGSA